MIENHPSSNETLKDAYQTWDELDSDVQQIIEMRKARAKSKNKQNKTFLEMTFWLTYST